jgi:hypothetical protein
MASDKPTVGRIAFSPERVKRAIPQMSDDTVRARLTVVLDEIDRLRSTLREVWDHHADCGCGYLPASSRRRLEHDRLAALVEMAREE